MITEYIILDQGTIGDMECLVNDKIEEGFQPRGELRCTGDNEEWVWTQVMVKEV